MWNLRPRIIRFHCFSNNIFLFFAYDEKYVHKWEKYFYFHITLHVCMVVDLINKSFDIINGWCKTYASSLISTNTSLFVIASKENGKNKKKQQRQTLSVIPKENCRRYRNRIKNLQKSLLNRIWKGKRMMQIKH